MKQNENSGVNLFGMGYVSNDGQIMTPSGEQMNLSELKEIAQKQQKLIELQQQNLVAKEQKLKFLKQQLHQSKSNENDRLRKLRVVVEAQEEKLLKVQALKEKLELQISQNSYLSRDVDFAKDEYENKQNTFSTLLTKVQELTDHLNELRQWKATNDINTNGSENTHDFKLEKIKNEVIDLNQAHREHLKSLKTNKEHLSCRIEDVAALDRQIDELTSRLEQKKLDSGSVPNDKRILKSASTGTLPRMHTIVAAVEPLVKQTNPSISSPPLKNFANSPYNQASTSQLSFPGSTLSLDHIGKSSQAPLRSMLQNQANGAVPSFGRQRALSAILDNRNSHAKAQENRNFYNMSMPPSTNKESKPDSAVSRLYPDSSQQKRDSFTAKVRPLVPGPNQQQSNLQSLPSTLSQQQPQASTANYYPLSTKSRSLDSPSVTSPSSAKIFAYKRPSAAQQAANVTASNSQANASVLNSSSQSSSHVRSPPPYPTSPNKTPLPAAAIPVNNSSESSEAHDSFSEERSFSVDIEALRRKFAHAPRPLKKRSSLSEADRKQRPVVPKVAYDQLYKKADIPFHRSAQEPDQRSTPPPAYDDSNQVSSPPFGLNQAPVQSESLNLPPDTVSYEKNLTPKEFLKQKNQSPVRFKPPKLNVTSPPPYERNDVVERSHKPTPPSQPLLPSLSAIPTKGILKLPSGKKKKPGRRIRFDPFALLLDASLEGDFQLVQRIISQVPNPSQSNDEGITALHNAVCACHFDLVKFLVHYGGDVNAADADGWTPLHCSASCNNLPMSRFLVENGACVFAATLSDGETAADKCEELDDGYLQCYEYLYGIQEKLGVARQGQVYALFDYEAENDDELSFRDGDLMTILRRGDDREPEWWWARLDHREGYIPRNLIGVWPRIKSNKEGRE